VKKDQAAKLSNYSIFSSAFLLLSNAANAQIIYTDVDPDETAFTDEVQIDMDNDGDVDFKLIFIAETFTSFSTSELKLRINPLGDNNVAFSTQIVPVTYSGLPWATYTGGATQVVFTVAPLINSGNVIDAELNFSPDLANLYQRLNFNIYSSYDHQAIAGGDWEGAVDKFAAFQFYFDGDLFYGWMRLSVDILSGITLHDYAYESIANTPIITEIVSYTPIWNLVEDAGILGTGEDIQFNFTAPGDEEDIDTYRIICVKKAIADAFTIDIANSLLPEQYLEIIPDGSIAYTAAFTALSKDSDGDLITVSQPYKLFILNVMDPAAGYANMISKASESVELIDTVTAVLDNTIADIDDLGNGLDIKVSFEEAETNQGISEYRVIVVKKDIADVFTLADAEIVAIENYIAVAPGEINYTVFLNELSTDSDGDLIEPAKYKSFILSVADGTSAALSAISEPSEVITLETQTSVVNSISLEDIAELGNGNDIKISFSIPALEQTISAYRVYLVDFATAFDFNVAVAQAVELPNYFAVIPDGNDIILNGNATTTDSEGNLITWGVPYYVYVLSVASVYGIEDTLSPQSNQVVLNFPVIENIEEINNADFQIYQSNNIVYLQINFQIENNATFTIFNNVGQKIAESKISQGLNEFPLDWKNGIYYGIIRSGKNIIPQKLIIAD